MPPGIDNMRRVPAEERTGVMRLTKARRTAVPPPTHARIAGHDCSTLMISSAKRLLAQPNHGRV